VVDQTRDVAAEFDPPRCAFGAGIVAQKLDPLTEASFDFVECRRRHGGAQSTAPPATQNAKTVSSTFAIKPFFEASFS
jgi:hypothetical protein